MGKSGIESVNVDTDQYTTSVHPYGAAANNLLLHRSGDGRHLVFASEIPDGAHFTETRDSLEEVQYIIKGTIRCTLESGEVLTWKAGDLVYWPYDQKMELEYSPGLHTVCFFWSERSIPIGIGDR
jgi:ethanolamine utilization protein EutQ (cupin superfamily)